ncbi:hypothetical protein HMN09_00061400 [Mycena chlorophos]|uniref:Uncharacterized protein n=1 Tax=Mycena chlorophos TaxID=658473 RepID=A0A8H6TT30_MYCCL|nr:hypothetical protein HMN09_00061400 [Mycena chlorophos]
MGSASSKAARSLPKRPAAKQTPWPRPTEVPGASETKNQAIIQDSKDPQFLAKLSQLGQVRVDHHMQTVQLASAARIEAESDALSSSPTLNRIPAPTLGRLLDERKTVRTRRDMEFMAKRFGLDIDKLDTVTRYVNTPSVRAGSEQRIVQEDGDEKFIFPAVWIEPQLKNTSS